ncbi:MAG: hypothetical protein ABIU05_16445 [Nitrospirales bacterium]
MAPNRIIEKETENFLKDCEALHALLARKPLAVSDRDLIIASARKLLDKLRLA